MSLLYNKMKCLRSKFVPREMFRETKVRARAGVCVRIVISVHVCMCLFVCVSALLSMCMYICVSLCVCLGASSRACVCVYVCVCV